LTHKNSDDLHLKLIGDFDGSSAHRLLQHKDNLLCMIIDYQVRDIMTPEPVSISSDVVLAEAEALFEEHDFNGIPVIDRNNRLIGFLTKLDLLKAFIFTEKAVIPDYRTIIEQSISQVMTKKVDVVDSGTPLTRVLQKMIETRNKSFPVVEDDRITGIVAREDILRALRRAANGQRPARLASSETAG